MSTHVKKPLVIAVLAAINKEEPVRRSFVTPEEINLRAIHLGLHKEGHYVFRRPSDQFGGFLHDWYYFKPEKSIVEGPVFIGFGKTFQGPSRKIARRSIMIH